MLSKTGDSMAKNVLMVIAKNNFRDEELFHTKESLEAAGLKTTIASSEAGVCEGKLGGTVNAELSLAGVKVADYSGVVFVGGSGAAQYFDDPNALILAKKFSNSKKITAAICIAPSVLANAGLLTGKNATAFRSEQQNLEAKGATFTGEPVTVDGKIVTANGPKAAKSFGKKIAELLK